MIHCPLCDKEMYWMNDWDDGEEPARTYTDYNCLCGTTVTIPWEREDGEEENV